MLVHPRDVFELPALLRELIQPHVAYEDESPGRPDPRRRVVREEVPPEERTELHELVRLGLLREVREGAVVLGGLTKISTVF